MTNREILALLKPMNYGCLFVMANGQQVKFGFGELKWRRDLQRMTDEQREALSERLRHWSERRSA